MPTNAYPASQYATMSAAQVLEAQRIKLEQLAREDADRVARQAAVLEQWAREYADCVARRAAILGER